MGSTYIFSLSQSIYNTWRCAAELTYLIDQASNMEVPHGIPTTKRTFKSWREFRRKGSAILRGQLQPLLQA